MVPHARLWSLTISRVKTGVMSSIAKRRNSRDSRVLAWYAPVACIKVRRRGDFPSLRHVECKTGRKAEYNLTAVSTEIESHLR